MSTHPYIPLYVDDYEAATAHLTVEEDGVYNRLLRLCWRTPGCSLPVDDVWIARKIRLGPADFERVARAVLDEFFKVIRGRYIQKRLKDEYDDISRKKSARKQAGKKGGVAKAQKDQAKLASIATVLPVDARAFPDPYPDPLEESVFSNENTVRPDLVIGLPDLMAEGFERWWKVYPKRRGKKAAASAFSVAVRKIGAKGHVGARIDFLIDRAQALADNLGAETTYAPDPERWLRGERWDDELKPRHAAGAAANGRHASPAQRPGVQHLHEAALALAQRRPGLASLLPRDCDVPDAAE